jgi:hypothetical protein
MLVRSFSQRDGVLQACTILQRTRHRQHLKPKRHRHRLAIHHMNLVSACAHQIPGLRGRLRSSGKLGRNQERDDLMSFFHQFLKDLLEGNDGYLRCGRHHLGCL